METQELRDLVENNRELEEQLTKKNQQYLFDLKKALNLANLSEEKKVISLSEMLPQLVEGQKTGQTARQLFGTVSERVDHILYKPEPVKEAGMKMKWLDNSLLLLGFLTLMSGLMPILSKNSDVNQQNGILTIIVSAISGGYAFYMIYKLVYQYDRPGADKSKKPKMLKSMGITAGIVVAWMAVFMLSALIPTSINVRLNSYVYLAIGVVTFVVRHFMRKKYNMTGSMFM